MGDRRFEGLPSNNTNVKIFLCDQSEIETVSIVCVRVY